MTKLGTPIGAGPKGAIVVVGLAAVGAPPAENCGAAVGCLLRQWLVAAAVGARGGGAARCRLPLRVGRGLVVVDALVLAPPSLPSMPVPSWSRPGSVLPSGWAELGGADRFAFGRLRRRPGRSVPRWCRRAIRSRGLRGRRGRRRRRRCRWRRPGRVARAPGRWSCRARVDRPVAPLGASGLGAGEGGAQRRRPAEAGESDGQCELGSHPESVPATRLVPLPGTRKLTLLASPGVRNECGRPQQALNHAVQHAGEREDFRRAGCAR